MIKNNTDNNNISWFELHNIQTGSMTPPARVTAVTCQDTALLTTKSLRSSSPSFDLAWEVDSKSEGIKLQFTD